MRAHAFSKAIVWSGNPVKGRVRRNRPGSAALSAYSAYSAVLIFEVLTGVCALCVMQLPHPYGLDPPPNHAHFLIKHQYTGEHQ
jgi:hypothetical protein